MASYWPAGDTCNAVVQFLVAKWLIFAVNGQSAEAAAVESTLESMFGASMTGA